VYSRNDGEISPSYPEVLDLDLEDGVIVDRELVALHAHGRPDFGLLQQPRRTGCIGADASVVDESPEGVADHGVDQPLAGERDEKARDRRSRLELIA
jgi:hypothetical protein